MMSFLAELQSAKKCLHPTDTLIRYADGSSALLHDGVTKNLPGQSYGFVVDTHPDNVPACIVSDWLYLGSQDSVEPNVFNEHRIANCLSIGIESPHRLNDVQHTFVPCLDLPETNLLAVLDQTDDHLDRIHRSGERVLVHCNAGVSRSASIVIGYLIRRKGYAYEAALELVKSKRACCRPNDGFVRQLKAVRVG